MLKDLLHAILKLAARVVLRKYHPTIVAITGSVGKTGTKEAVFAVLATRFRAARSRSNYNNEVGLPLAVLGADSGGRSLWRWLAIAGRFSRLMIGTVYPELLVLEMGADKPGDVKYLTGIARPSVAVVTRVGSAHLGQLGDIETVQREKAQLVAALSKDGLAILNFDDPRVYSMRSLHPGKSISVGLGDGADVRAENVAVRQAPLTAEVTWASSLALNFTIRDGSGHRPVSLPGTIGLPSVYTYLLAYAIGRHFEISPQEIQRVLGRLRPPPGRLRLLDGVKGTLLIDDSYNSSPEAAQEALKALTQVRARRRLAVLGDMLELGQSAEREHRRIGRLIRLLNLDVLSTVGPAAGWIADEARQSGFPKTRVQEFASAAEAAARIGKSLAPGDVVLIKGSQGVRMEQITAALLADPAQAARVLVRQSAEWKQAT